MNFGKFKVELVAEWRHFYRMYSIWAMVIMGMLPDIYNELVASGIFEGTEVDHIFARIAKLVALIGVLSRLIKQAKIQAAALEAEQAQT